MAERTVKGLSELQKFLDTLTPKLEANIMRGALRAGMKEVLPVAKQNINSVSGELAKGLKISTRIERKNKRVVAKIKATGPHAFVAHFVEFGTKPHTITAKEGSLQIDQNFVGGSVEHPGAKRKPFLRPALDQKATSAVVATGEYIKKRLTKHGLDTSHITVEGDE